MDLLSASARHSTTALADTSLEDISCRGAFIFACDIVVCLRTKMAAEMPF